MITVKPTTLWLLGVGLGLVKNVGCDRMHVQKSNHGLQ